jgi:hypothetical protein
MFNNNALTILGKNEVATAREANLAIAKIQARYVLALQNPRDLVKEVEPKIAELCSRKEFALTAKYNVVVGGHWENGKWVKDYDIDLNIRAAEQLMVCHRNIMSEVNTVYEDDILRRVSFEMTDLETGVTHRDEFTIYKTMERKKLKTDYKTGEITQDALDTRTNSAGEQIYIVACTPEDVQKKQNAQVSRKMRKMFFRLFPADLKIKARKWIDETIQKDVKENINDERAKITTAFAKHGVTGDDLENFIGEKLSRFNPEDIVKLREIWQSLEDGISHWSDYVINPEPEVTPVSLGKPKEVKEEKRENKEEIQNKADSLGTKEENSGQDNIPQTTGLKELRETSKKNYESLSKVSKLKAIAEFTGVAGQSKISVNKIPNSDIKQFSEIVEKYTKFEVASPPTSGEEEDTLSPAHIDNIRNKAKYAWLDIEDMNIKEELKKHFDTDLAQAGRQPVSHIIIARMEVPDLLILHRVFKEQGVYEENKNS